MHRRRHLLLAFRVLASVALLYVLYRRRPPDFQFSDMLPANAGGGAIWWLLGGLMLLFGAFLLQTLRWQMVLKILGVEMPLERLLPSFFAASFVSNALPTTFGGDYIRVARIGAATDDRPAAFASVVLERLTGWVALPVVALVAMCVQPYLFNEGKEAVISLVTCAITIGLLLGVLLLASAKRFSSHSSHGTGWRAFIGAVHIAVVRLRRDERRFAEVLIVSAAFVVAQCLSVYMLGRAGHVEGASIGVLMWFFPVVAIIQNLPLAIGGLGIREGMFVLFLSDFGTPDAKAISLGLAVYVSNVIVSFAGAPSFVMGHRRDVELEVDEAELAEEIDRRAAVER